MRKALAISAAAATAAILISPSVSAGSRASTYRLKAWMTPQQVVTPQNKRWRVPSSVRHAHGSFTGTMVLVGRNRTLRWRIRYTGVGSSPLQVADIHYGKPGQFGPVIKRLCGPCESGQSGKKKLSAWGARSIKAGNAWITIITGTYRNGVIRGQIKVS
jgi:CHRD domain